MSEKGGLASLIVPSVELSVAFACSHCAIVHVADLTDASVEVSPVNANPVQGMATRMIKDDRMFVDSVDRQVLS